MPMTHYDLVHRHCNHHVSSLGIPISTFSWPRGILDVETIRHLKINGFPSCDIQVEIYKRVLLVV